MNSRPAMTYTPDVQVGDDGVEYYDFDGGEVVNRSGGQSYEHPYEIDQETGERHYLIEDSDLQQDMDYEPSVAEEYLQAIHELYPDLADAQEYARQNWHPDLIAEFDEAVGSDNLDHFVPMLEELMEEYRQTVGAPADDEEEAEVTQSDIDMAIEPMLNQEPEGMEAAYQWLEGAAHHKEANPCLSAICQATASFHAGEVSASEAIQSVIDKYDIKEVAAIYKQLLNEQ